MGDKKHDKVGVKTKASSKALSKAAYLEQLAPLELQLNDLARWLQHTGKRLLVVVEGLRVLGVIQLKDIVKGGIKERFGELRRMGIKTVMITGDNPLTAAAIADEAGVDGFLAEATPEDKMALIKREQASGNLVAMTGDGTNDAPALAQADVGVAMNTGTSAAKEAGNMVDLDSNPTKLIEIVEIGKQLLMTRGSLTTYSIASRRCRRADGVHRHRLPIRRHRHRSAGLGAASRRQSCRGAHRRPAGS